VRGLGRSRVRLPAGQTTLANFEHAAQSLPAWVEGRHGCALRVFEPSHYVPAFGHPLCRSGPRAGRGLAVIGWPVQSARQSQTRRILGARPFGSSQAPL